MKIYELRCTSQGDAEELIFGQRPESVMEEVLSPARIFTSWELARRAADQDQEELHLECLTQEQIDSEELSVNVIDDLEWDEEVLGTYTAHNEALGMSWVIREHEIAN